VLKYIHTEVVTHTEYKGGSPHRHYGIGRILRFVASVSGVPDVHGVVRPFGPFVAFDKGRCSVPACAERLRESGYKVGCQVQHDAHHAYEEAAWFSFPGTCPTFTLPKEAGCSAIEPGGECVDGRVLGVDCTWVTLRLIGEIELDEVEGIGDEGYAHFVKRGGREYVQGIDRGIGMNFWNGVQDRKHCAWRVHRVRSLFRKKYPEQAWDLPAPASCI